MSNNVQPDASPELRPQPAKPRANYHRLTAEARETIRWSGVSIADYVRRHDPDGQWSGDRCGCTDDRCIGYHHDERQECGCLPVLLDNVVAEQRAACEAVAR